MTTQECSRPPKLDVFFVYFLSLEISNSSAMYTMNYTNMWQYIYDYIGTLRQYTMNCTNMKYGVRKKYRQQNIASKILPTKYCKSKYREQISSTNSILALTQLIHILVQWTLKSVNRVKYVNSRILYSTVGN